MGCCACWKLWAGRRDRSAASAVAQNKRKPGSVRRAHVRSVRIHPSCARRTLRVGAIATEAMAQVERCRRSGLRPRAPCANSRCGAAFQEKSSRRDGAPNGGGHSVFHRCRSRSPRSLIRSRLPSLLRMETDQGLTADRPRPTVRVPCCRPGRRFPIPAGRLRRGSIPRTGGFRTVAGTARRPGRRWPGSRRCSAS